MELHFKVTGALLMVLSLIHIGFPRYFQWEKELSGLGLMNRQMMIVHTFFIALVVAWMGAISFFKSSELTETPFGRFVSLSMGVFWSIRLIFQWFVYSSKLWKGKRFETSMHFVFSLLWIYLAVIHLYNYFLWKHPW